MAYRFNGSTGYVEFAIAPFNGHVFGPFTIAFFWKRNSANNHALVAFTDGSNYPPYLGPRLIPSALDMHYGAFSASSSSVFTSTSVWYLLVLTKAAAPSGTIRIHYHDGTSWTHVDGGGGGVGSSNLAALAGTDHLKVGRFENAGAGLNFLDGDVVCVGVKNADSSDSTVQTLSRTAWSAWTTYGFDWLIGFDSSLTSGGLLQDQASPGTGDETAKTGTSVVADPPGWSWLTSTTWNGSSTVSLTDTVTTAGARVGVTYHGASTVTMTATVTTASKAVTLHAVSAVPETVTVTTRASLARMTLVPTSLSSMVLLPRPPDSLTLAPR